MYKKLIFSLIVALAGLTSCNNNSSYKNVSISDLKVANEANYLILDVRQPEEYQQGHVPNAKLIPLGELESRISEIPDDTTVYVICRSGNRSKTAAGILSKNGKTDERNVEGGTLAWQAAGYSVIR